MKFEFTQNEALMMPDDVMKWLNAMQTISALPDFMKERMVELIVQFRERPAKFWESNKLYLDWEKRDVRVWIVQQRSRRNRVRTSRNSSEVPF